MTTWDRRFIPFDALIVETDVGLDGLPVLGGTGCGERFLIVRERAANTRERYSRK